MISKNIKDKIKEYFFLNPTAKMRVRHIERKLGLPLPSVIRYCKELSAEGILKKVVIDGVVFYTAERSSEVFLLEKRLFNIRQIYSSGLVRYLREEFSNPTIVLFGSYARGEDVEESDIDIYLESPSKKKVDVSKFERVLQRRVQLFKFKSIKKVGNKRLADNIINGITLNGFLKVFE
ncbi:MAG: nucleotidyltransferase domain-containing protein [Nanoarchaeota archaeon]|nr:nucleotidyltransferase domain-containing protein [Nanoarchaeota archaeon]